MTKETKTIQKHDFVIVGSGAGGGPLAANLSLEGYSVLLIEAGTDKINDNYSVPAFHAFSTEDPLYSWEFYVKHYTNNPDRDPKYHKKTDDSPGSAGIFYPRASALGGCTTHHAMITVYPHESDWNYIADLVKDNSWSAKNMRKYFDCIEHTQYRGGSVLLKVCKPLNFLRGLLRSLTGTEPCSGTRKKRGVGWLTLNQADPFLLLKDIKGVLKVVLSAYKTSKAHGLECMPGLNPNDPLVAKENLQGINVIPLSVYNGKRTGARERVLQAQKYLYEQQQKGEKVGRLDIVTNTFATNVVFDEDSPTVAVGVRCVSGEALYSARHHKRKAGKIGESIVYKATKEVILCGGAFNTPQLLMLSGIGPRDELECHNINVRIESPGVGKNLQDRYEVGIISKANNSFKLLDKATFKGRVNSTDSDPDSVFTHWRENGKGIYATNGSVLGIIKRSSTRTNGEAPDLYIFGVPGYFGGYEIGYAKKAVQAKDYFTWAILKGHTNNTSGKVTLKSKDPFETPDIHFKYFEEGSKKEDADDDVESVVDGIKFVQEINERLEKQHIFEKQVVPNQKENLDLHSFVKDNAWGHHASCTCKIGADNDPEAVLDKDFQVRGAKNLRVVDASVFPKIPGLFILASVYMISEKASDVIIKRYK